MMKSHLRWTTIVVLLLGVAGPEAFAQARRRGGDADKQAPTALYDKWELKEVTYKKTGKSFVPKTYGGISFSKGQARWHDGVNSIWGPCRIEKDSITIDKNRCASTMIGSDLVIEDVHYADVTRYEMKGDTLLLHTPEQTYRLERYPFSKMSLRGWSLYSIIDNKTKDEFVVDRFRTAYRHLYFRAQEDKTFTFTDLDREKYTGTLEVDGANIANMKLDEASQKKLDAKEVVEDFLSDNTNRYQKTKKRYPTTYAKSVDFKSITKFAVVDGFLELYSKEKTYKFTGR